VPWFKVDDKHHDHKKTRKALRGVSGKRRDAAAMGLWELAGSWCADNLTDGFVPTDELYRWDDAWEALAARLVAAGYWLAEEVDGEPGYRFANWAEHQPMKDEVEAKREAARERMRALRSGSGARSSAVRANETGSDASSSVTPSRPVPTRPDPGESRPRATQLPEDFQPSEANIQLAITEGIDLRREFAKFCDHHQAKGSTFKDWHKALNSWIRKAAEYSGNVRPLPRQFDPSGEPVLPIASDDRR